MALWNFSAREVRSRPGRATLTLTSIVLGVAAVVAVTIATGTTRKAYQQMFETMTGKTDLEIVAEGGGEFDDSILSEIEGVSGVKAVTPVIQRPSILYHEGTRAKIIVMGIDPERQRAIHDFEVTDGKYFGSDDGVLLATSFAKGIRAKVGDKVRLLTSRRRLQYSTVVGLIAPRGASGLGSGGVLFMPLARTQELFTGPNQIGAIQIALQDRSQETAVVRALEKDLPEELIIQRPVARTQMADQTMLASEQGLRLASALSLVLAAFIILNAFLMNVGERRRQLAVMRAIGATRRQIMNLLLWEGVVMGIAGTVLGIAVGLVGAHYMTQAMSQLFQVQLPTIMLTPLSVALAAVFGLGISLLSTYLPARKAGQLSPLEGMRAVAAADMEPVPRWMLYTGLFVVAGGLFGLYACIRGWLPIEGSVYAAMAALGGIVLILPSCLPPLARLVAALLSPFLHLEARLACRQILRRRVRTGLTVVVLFLGVTAGIGIANSVIDNIEDVNQWREQSVKGDFVVRAMMPDMATGMSADIPQELGGEIKRIKGVKSLDTIRYVSAKAEGLPVVVIVKEFTANDAAQFDMKSGKPEQVRQQLFEGQVVLGTVLAQRTGLEVGDTISVETADGAQDLTIAATANEYLVGGLAMYMQRDAARRLFKIEGVDAFVVRVDPQDYAVAEAEIRKLGESKGLLVQSAADVTQLIDSIMSGIVGALWALLALGFVVAAFGVVNTLTMNVMEQTREIGLLRIVAMTRRQIRKTILAQAIIMGVIGLGPGILTGVIMAYLMNLTMQPVLGRAIDFVIHPVLLAGTFFGGLLIVTLAAWFPAQRAARLQLIESLHYE